MSRFYIKSVGVLFMLLLTGCLHDHPSVMPDGEIGVDPTLVSVDADVTLDLSMEPFKARGMFDSEDADVLMRFIIEVNRNGKVVERIDTLVSPSAVVDNRIQLPVGMKLHALQYSVMVWADFVDAVTREPLYYDATSLRAVTYLSPYRGNAELRQCFCGLAQLDLRSYRDKWYASSHVSVELKRPLAKYRIVATDIKEFLNRHLANRDGGARYVVTFSYSYIPAVYNVLESMVDGDVGDVGFSFPLDLSLASEDEIEVGFDYLFAVPDQVKEVTLTIKVVNSMLIPVSKVSDIPIPYEQGTLTTIKGDFLTNEIGGSIVIDTKWGNEIIIEI